MARDGEHEDDGGDGGTSAEAGSQRLDKWLWFVRVIKSRTQASHLVSDGKVRINRERTIKPSQLVRIGDVVTITVRGHVRILKMLAAGTRRGPPPEARLLYEDLTPPPVPRSEAALGGVPSTRLPGTGRPTKRDRRRLDRMKGEG